MVTVPLIVLALASVLAGVVYFEPMLFGEYFGSTLDAHPERDTVARLAEAYHGSEGLGLIVAFVAHGVMALPFWLALAGIVSAWYLYVQRPELPETIAARARTLYVILYHKYGVDEFYQFVFAGGTRRLGNLLWRVGDVRLIDGLAVNGTARVVGWVSGVVRRIQSGYVFHYAFAMIIGLFLLMTWFLRP